MVQVTVGFSFVIDEGALDMVRAAVLAAAACAACRTGNGSFTSLPVQVIYHDQEQEQEEEEEEEQEEQEEEEEIIADDVVPEQEVAGPIQPRPYNRAPNPEALIDYPLIQSNRAHNPPYKVDPATGKNYYVCEADGTLFTQQGGPRAHWISSDYGKNIREECCVPSKAKWSEMVRVQLPNSRESVNMTYRNALTYLVANHPASPYYNSSSLVRRANNNATLVLAAAN